jgi:hypothetical protein
MQSRNNGGERRKIVQMNFAAIDQTLANLFEVEVPGKITSTFK